MIDNIDKFKEHMLECYPQEAVGYVVEGIYFPLENVHPDPVDNFLVSEHDSFTLLELDYTLVHSHCMASFKEDPRTPSLSDMQGQKDTAVLWGITHCDGENVSKVLYFGKPTLVPLLRRRYIRNVYDCFTLARDYYAQQNIRSPECPRPPNWEEWNPYYLLQELEKTPFKAIPKENVVKGDLLVFRIAAPQPNHFGIALGGDKFMHHLANRVSCEDSISKWHNQYIKTLRHSDDLFS